MIHVYVGYCLEPSPWETPDVDSTGLDRMIVFFAVQAASEIAGSRIGCLGKYAAPATR